ncbi:MAG: hypothetical protein RQM92_11520 [Candidatus Syntrophopropionicum ammoniitolerans]
MILLLSGTTAGTEITTRLIQEGYQLVAIPSRERDPKMQATGDWISWTQKGVNWLICWNKKLYRQCWICPDLSRTGLRNRLKKCAGGRGFLSFATCPR